jgi:hypothetical protein
MTTSQGVDGKGIRMGLDAFANHLTGIILVTGRRTSFEKLLEEGRRSGITLGC